MIHTSQAKFPIARLFSLMFLLALTLMQVAFSADTYVRIENRFKPTQQINVENGPLTSSPIHAGAFSADWVFEPVDDTNTYVRIKNRFTNAYIHNQTEDTLLEMGTIKPDWYGAMWEIIPVLPASADKFYQIKSRRTDGFLHSQFGTLGIGALGDPNWWSAQWALRGYTPLTRTGIVRASYDPIPYVKDTRATNNWKWMGTVPFTMPIYNPLDGGVLMKYTQTIKLGDSDGCSGPGDDISKQFFRDACFAHDTHYDMPMGLAGFPKYGRGGSIGEELAGYLFLKDMLLLAKERGAAQNITETAANWWYRLVLDFGSFRGDLKDQKNAQGQLKYSADAQKVDAKDVGGVIAVQNNGAYTMGLRVTWTDPKGIRRKEELLNHGGRAAVVPLSLGTTDIEAECWAVGGTQIFKKTFSKPGMYAFTVRGTTLIHPFEDGLTDNQDSLSKAGSDIKAAFVGAATPAGARSIKFRCEAGYAASLVVNYFVNENIGGVTVPMAKRIETEKITGGFVRTVIVPNTLAAGFPITIQIYGAGTLKNPVLTENVPADFKGERTYTAEGTIFNASAKLSP